jgi:hypothetical protein
MTMMAIIVLASRTTFGFLPTTTTRTRTRTSSDSLAYKKQQNHHKQKQQPKRSHRTPLFVSDDTKSTTMSSSSSSSSACSSACSSSLSNQTSTTRRDEIPNEYNNIMMTSSSPRGNTITESVREFITENKTFLSPDIVAVVAVYFVEGALGLARLAQTFLLKDELHLGPAELSALTGIFTLPWTIKPLYGFLSDGFPLFGYRRRSYLLLAGLTGCLSYSLVGHQFFGMLDNHPNAMIPGTVTALGK